MAGCRPRAWQGAVLEHGRWQYVLEHGRWQYVLEHGQYVLEHGQYVIEPVELY